MTTPNVGDPLPDFSAETNQGNLTSKDLIGQPLVLYFYPRDNTPGCTNQANDFQQHLKDFEELAVRVIGVSRDNLRSHERFAEKFDLQFPLIADPEENLCNLFQVMKDKNMYGRKVRGIERSTFLFDSQGKLVQEWRKVKVPGHVLEVLQAAKAL